jgi:hypothetical protein
MTTTTFVDLVKCQVLSAGTEPFALGPPVEGFRGVGALIDGREYSYSVQQGANYEYGKGVYSQPSGTLTRAVLGSSRNGQPVDFGVGAVVTFTLLSVDLESFDPVDAVTSVSIIAPGLGLVFDPVSFIDGALILGMSGVLTPAGGGVPEGGLRYRINVSVIAAPTAAEILGIDVTDAPYTFPADFDGSRFLPRGAWTEAGAEFTFHKLVDGEAPEEIGTLVVSDAGVATFETTDNEPVTILPGEGVSVTFTGTPDPSFVDFAIKLSGVLE